MNSVVTHLAPPAITFALALALHMFAKERALRVGLLPIAAGIFIGWAVIARPGWVPVDDVRRVVHIAVGAALLGLALDAVKPPRLVAAILATLFLIGCAFPSVTGSLIPKAPISLADGLMTGALTIAAFLVLARFDAMRERPLNLCLLMTLVAGGLAVLAEIGHDAPLTALALVLATALAGYLVFVILTGAPVSDGMILISGAPMLALVWALVQRHPDLRLALLCFPLVLFAEATALRVPLPAARISALLYPLVFAGVVSLPLILAGLIAFVTSIP